MKSLSSNLARILAPGGAALLLLLPQAACTHRSSTTSSAVYAPTAAVPGAPLMAASGVTTAAFGYPNATITSATLVAMGAIEAAGSSGQSIQMPEYVKVLGKLNQRTSPVDGKSYAIMFEMRLPTMWNGRFFHQVNGGTDGGVVAATGDILGGGQASCALSKGFAVISSDAGHETEAGTIGGGLFGIDPQARLDYGYNAVGQLTPMAKALIKFYYGKTPDKSYICGTSNGGRHTMVAASRFGDQYDGFLVGSPGFNLPKAAVAQLWGVQQYATIATTKTTGGRPDITSSFSPTDLDYLASCIVAKCDSLDGVADNMVSNWEAAQTTFDIDRDTITCTGAPNGTCLTSAQKAILKAVHAGAKDSGGNALYTNYLWDRGINNRSSSGWRQWKFINSTTNRDPLSVAFIFLTPPVSPAAGQLDGTGTTLLDYALNYSGATTPRFNVDTDAPRIFSTNAIYTESAMSFMTMPDPLIKKMVANNGKMMVVQGSADPVFSVQDTINWYKSVKASYGDTATSAMLRMFVVPGMGHSRGGPCTDQYDMLDALVKWVEQGTPPDSVIATARGAGGTNLSVNTDVPVTGPGAWAPNRSRPLCPYPQVPKYVGTDGNYDKASNFVCAAP